jgi:hypothetical protein
LIEPSHAVVKETVEALHEGGGSTSSPDTPCITGFIHPRAAILEAFKAENVPAQQKTKNFQYPETSLAGSDMKPVT